VTLALALLSCPWRALLSPAICPVGLGVVVVPGAFVVGLGTQAHLSSGSAIPSISYQCTNPDGQVQHGASVGALVVVHAKHIGHPSVLLFDCFEPHGHGAQVGVGVVGFFVVHGRHIGHPGVLLLDCFDPHGQGAHVGAGVCCTGGSVGAFVVHGKQIGQPSLRLF
jgi:hypothetical protein